MEVGDIITKMMPEYIVGMLSKEERVEHRWRILKIYPQKHSCKDLILCEDADYGFKECFHRMDLENKEDDINEQQG